MQKKKHLQFSLKQYHCQSHTKPSGHISKMYTSLHATTEQGPTFKLNKANSNKQFAVTVSDTPVTLRHGQGHQTGYKSGDPMRGNR